MKSTVQRLSALFLVAGLTLACEAPSREIASVREVPPEGVGSSGGGIGVQCGAKLQTLDLYEAEHIHGLTLNPIPTDFSQGLIKMARGLVAYLTENQQQTDEEILAEVKKEVLDKFLDVAPGSLDLSSDATLPQIPDTCKFVQIALYEDATNTIKRDPALWNMLDFRERIALIEHEAVFKVARDSHSRTSDDTRRVVGLLHSTQGIEPMFTEIEGKQGALCMSGFSDSPDFNPNATFVQFVDTTQDGKSGVKGYFSIIGGTFLLSKTTTFIPGLNVDSILKYGLLNVSSPVQQPLMDRTWRLEGRRDPSIIDPPAPGSYSQVRSYLEGSTPKEYMPATCLPGRLGHP